MYYSKLNYNPHTSVWPSFSLCYGCTPKIEINIFKINLERSYIQLIDKRQKPTFSLKIRFNFVLRECLYFNFIPWTKMHFQFELWLFCSCLSTVITFFVRLGQERLCDSPSLSPSVDETNTPLQSQPSSSASSSPERLGMSYLLLIVEKCSTKRRLVNRSAIKRVLASELLLLCHLKLKIIKLRQETKECRAYFNTNMFNHTI